jgi:hypothetical protein
MGSIEAPADWFDGFFEGAWLDDIALHAPTDRTELQVSFLLDRLEGAPGDGCSISPAATAGSRCRWPGPAGT